MIDQLEYMIKEVEVLMRGGKTETVKLIADAKAMIFYLSSSDALDFCDTLSDDQRTLYATAAVRLHNKARNLNRKQLNDIRVLLKAVSAWSILTFHTELTKKLPIVIKMLSEVEKYFCNTDEMTDLGLICCKAIIQSWDIGIENAIEKICPPLEMTELKSAVFQSYLDASIILSNHLRSNYSEVKQFTTSAMDLSQSLPRQNKLNLVYCLSQVAFKGLEAELGQEVKYFFLISLNVLDEISQPQKKIFADVEEDSFEPNMEEIDVLKIKIQLALSHIYAETNECNKAKICVTEAEKLILVYKNKRKDMEHLIAWSYHEKVFILIKDSDVENAAIPLKALLDHNGIDFETSLRIVNLLMDNLYKIDAVTGNCIRNDIYKAFMSKFQCEPEYTHIRLHYLQSILANCNEGIDNTNITDKACEISNSIVKNLAGLKDNSNIEKFLAILIERLSWYNVQGNWEKMLEWCDILIKAAIAVESDILVGALLNKVEALLNLFRYSESLQVATEAFAQFPSSKTLVMKIRSALHADHNNFEDAIDIFYQDESKIPSEGSFSSEDCLSRLILTQRILQESDHLSEEVKHNIFSLIDREWIEQYIKRKAWQRSTDFEKADEQSENQPTLAYIVTRILNAFNMKYLHFVEEVTTANIEPDTINLESKGTIDEDNPMDITETIITGNKDDGYVDQSIRCEQEIHSTHTETHTSCIVRCSLQEIVSIPLITSELLIKALYKAVNDSLDFYCLGVEVDLCWIGENAHRMGSILAQTDVMALIWATASEKPQHMMAKAIKMQKEKLIIAARFFEISAAMFDILHLSSNKQDLDHRVSKSLIASAAVRVDLNQILESKTYLEAVDFWKSCRMDENSESVSTNTSFYCSEVISLFNYQDLDLEEKLSDEKVSMQIASLHCKKSSQLLSLCIDFADEETLELSASSFVLEFAIMCKLGNIKTTEKFVEDNQSTFLLLSATQLERCARISQSDVGGSMDVTRKILNYTLQVTLRTDSPDYVLVGQVYKRIIELSPSRQAALEKINDFEQLAKSLCCTDSSDSTLPFNSDDVDNIIILAYNYGGTLAELDQIQLAEKFVSKAISMSVHGTKALSNYLPRMQDSYVRILMAAGRQKESDTGHNLSIHKSSVDQAQELKSKSFSDRSNKDFAISLESLMK